MWWVRFGAYATVFKFRVAIGLVKEPNLPDNEEGKIDISSDKEKQKKAARQRNIMETAILQWHL